MYIRETKSSLAISFICTKIFNIGYFLLRHIFLSVCRVDDLTKEAHELQKEMMKEVDEILIITPVPIKDSDKKVQGEREAKS